MNNQTRLKLTGAFVALSISVGLALPIVAVAQTNSGGLVGEVTLSDEYAPNTSICHVTRSMGRGARGEDVKALQIFLSEQGFFKGTVTGYFGPITESALTQFQLGSTLVRDVKDGGVFGPLTRGYFKTWCGGIGVSTQTPTSTITQMCEHPAPPQGCLWQRGATCADDRVICTPTPTSTPTPSAEYWCQLPCTGAAPSQNFEINCSQLLSKEQCTAYTSHEFPYRCEWRRRTDYCPPVS